MVMTETTRPMTTAATAPEPQRGSVAGPSDGARPAPDAMPARAAAPGPSGSSSPAATGPTRAAVALPSPAAFRTGDGPEERLIGQVAFALAAEAGSGRPPGQEGIEALRAQASAALSDFAFRYLHNHAEEIRREAAQDAAAKAVRPPGFLTLVAANLVALALVGGAAATLAMNPQLLAGLAGP